MKKGLLDGWRRKEEEEEEEVEEEEEEEEEEKKWLCGVSGEAKLITNLGSSHNEAVMQDHEQGQVKRDSLIDGGVYL